MKKVTKLLLVVLMVVIATVSLTGCQAVTKKYGGTTTIDIPKGKKLVPYTVQWEPNNSNLWYLTEDAEEGYQPKNYEFHESSNMGAMEGTIIFVEH
jgi:hypothetical protein